MNMNPVKLEIDSKDKEIKLENEFKIEEGEIALEDEEINLDAVKLGKEVMGESITLKNEIKIEEEEITIKDQTIPLFRAHFQDLYSEEECKENGDTFKEIPVSLFYSKMETRILARRFESKKLINLENNHVESDEDIDLDDETTDPDFNPDAFEQLAEDIHEDSIPPSYCRVSVDENQENATETDALCVPSKRRPRFQWKQSSSEDSTPTYEYIVEESNVIEVSEPITYFKRFFTDEVLALLVDNSNLYSVQKKLNKPLNVNKTELEQWLGLCIYFSISKLPNIRMHWSRKLGLQEGIVSAVMSRNRWEAIKSNFHMVNNDLQPNANDKLFKVRPLIDHLRSKFQEIPFTQSLCVDEQIVPYKDHSSLKHYRPSKPHEWGFKIFVLVDSKGMTYDFIPYTGKINPVDNPDVPDLKASANIVLHLAQVIPSNKNHRLYFDNWFTSLPLMQHLAKRGIWCCGTVHVPRLSGIARGKDNDKELMKKGRGSFEVKNTVGEEVEVTYVKWFDNRVINIISTFAKAYPILNVQRYDSKQARKVEVSCPNIIHLYNKAMGGVDLADCLIALYRIDIRSKKYYHRLIFHMIDMVIVNSWLLYRRDLNALETPKSECLSLAEFKLSLANALCWEGKPGPVKRGRPSLEKENEVRKRGRPFTPVTEKGIRYDNVGHLPDVEKVRRICKLEKCKGRTNIVCTKCKINLCLNNKNNCFLRYHSK